MHCCRSVRVVGLNIQIETDDAPTCQHLDRLLVAFPSGVRSERQASVEVRIRRSMRARRRGPRSPHGFDLLIDGALLLEDVPLWRIEDVLLFRLNRWFVENDPDHLHLHAGAVSRGGNGAVIVGRSGTGKSTLTTHLVRRGWDYLTDETVAVDRRGDLHAYPRPPTLKPGAWPLFADVPTVARAQDDALTGRVRAHIPPGQLGVERQPADPVSPALVVVLTPEPVVADRPVAAPLAPEVVVAELVANSMDLARLGLDGMRSLVQSGARSRGLRLRRGPLAATDALLADALEQSHAPSTVEEVPPPRLFPAAGPCRGPDVHTWVLDGRGAIVYDQAGGVTLQLDAPSAEIWRAFDGTRSVEDIAGEHSARTSVAREVVAADIDAFRGELARAGLLRPDAGEVALGP